MNKHICVLMTGFLVLCLGLGCDNGSEAGQPIMHMSERVKIKRPETPMPAKAEEQQVAEMAIPSAKIEELVTEVHAVEKAQSLDPAVVVQKETGSVHVAMAVPSATAVPVAVNVETPLEAPLNRPATVDVPEQAEASDLLGEKQALFGDQEKYYVKKGRIDPFEPFLHKPEPKAADPRTQEVQRRKPRTPLERIALGQLKLTAVMHLTNDQLKMAMVEDNNGKGYIVKQGTYIGENGGRVSGIEENKVIIEETYNDVFGKTSVRQMELKLQKQPGE